MKTLLFSLLMLLSLPKVFAEDCGQRTWSKLSLDERAQLLIDLDYFSSELPPCLKALKLEDLKLASHKEYAETIISTFHETIDREGIEQSDYIVESEPELTSLFVLVSDQGIILGGYVSFYQAGLDEEGNEADISWSAQLRFNAAAVELTDENGTGYDDHYYEWSGH